MIVVDTSALMAIAMGEAAAESCLHVLNTGDTLAISAATLAEAIIVARGRNRLDDFAAILDELDLEVVPVDEATARKVGATYARWGKGFHVASLNFADCFAYTLAKERDCPLLYVGNDFARTDVRSALGKLA